MTVEKIYNYTEDMTEKEIAIDLLERYEALKIYRAGQVAEENFGDDE